MCLHRDDCQDLMGALHPFITDSLAGIKWAKLHADRLQHDPMAQKTDSSIHLDQCLFIHYKDATMANLNLNLVLLGTYSNGRLRYEDGL